LEEGVHPGSIVLLLKAFIFDVSCRDNITSWHRPKLKEFKSDGGKKYVTFTMDFGKFMRCGFYDWKLVRLTKSGKLQSVAKIMNMEDLN
jgi:starch synthase